MPPPDWFVTRTVVSFHDWWLMGKSPAHVGQCHPWVDSPGRNWKETDWASREEQASNQNSSYDRSDHIYFIILFLEMLVVVFRAEAQKSLEKCWELGKPLLRNWEDNAASDANDEAGLVKCQRETEPLLGPLRWYSELGACGSVSLGLKNQTWLTDQQPWGETFALLRQLMLVTWSWEISSD